jgi:hypothetical protein
MEFRKYKVFNSSAVREFYSILRAAIKGAKSIGRLDLLINDKTVPRIMGKMPYADWKEWAGVDQGGLRGFLREVRGAEVAGCPQRGRRETPTLGAGRTEKGEGNQQQSISGKDAARAQGDQQTGGCRKRGDPAVP